jgi:two-component system LytT family response regulator
MNLRCFAIDDEPLALKQMCSYIKQTPFLELVGAYNDAVTTLEKINELQPDLLFADINMPVLNGVDMVRSLTHPCMVIFTTAYDQYALEGFQVDAVDYLLKPISYPAFLKAANKALKLHQAASKLMPEILSGNDEGLFVKSDYRVVRIRFNEIKYIEGMREYVRIHLTDGKYVMTLLSMKALEEKLPTGQFMRVHRSYIVNLNKINVIERNRIVFDEGVYIPISEQYKEAFQGFVDRSFLQT